MIKSGQGIRFPLFNLLLYWLYKEAGSRREDKDRAQKIHFWGDDDSLTCAPARFLILSFSFFFFLIMCTPLQGIRFPQLGHRISTVRAQNFHSQGIEFPRIKVMMIVLPCSQGIEFPQLGHRIFFVFSIYWHNCFNYFLFRA